MCNDNNENVSDENQENVSPEDIYFPPKRMNPTDTIFRFIQSIKQMILGIGVGSLALIKESPKYALLFIGAFLLLLLIISFFSWLRHTYRVEDGEFRVEKGIFVRKRSYISINRIHKIDFTANVLHRILNLVQVNVDTAAGGGGEELTAVRIKDARKLRGALQGDQTESEQKEPGHEDEKKNPLEAVSWRYLFLAGMTSGSAGFLMLGGWLLFSQVQQFIPDSAYEQTLDYVIQLGVIVLIIMLFLSLVALWMLGTLGTVIKYGHFTIEKRPEELFVKRGLLETKELTIPYDRIQAIEVQQNILRKVFNVSRVVAITAASGEFMQESNPIIYPLLPDKDVERFLEKFVPEYAGMDSELISLDRKGLKYYLGKHSFLFVLAFIPIAYFFPTYSWIPGLFIILSLLFGWMKHKETGYRIDRQRMLTRNWHGLTKSRTVFFRRRVHGYQKRQHKLQQFEGLATADFDMISLGAQVVLRHLSDEDANLIGDWHSRRGN